MLARERACGSRDVLVDGDPQERREELLEGLELLRPDAREELDANDLARRDCLVAADQARQELDLGLGERATYTSSDRLGVPRL